MTAESRDEAVLDPPAILILCVGLLIFAIAIVTGAARQDVSLLIGGFGGAIASLAYGAGAVTALDRIAPRSAPLLSVAAVTASGGLVALRFGHPAFAIAGLVLGLAISAYAEGRKAGHAHLSTATR